VTHSSLEPLNVDMERTEEGLTAFGGMPVPIDAWAGLGLQQAATEHLSLKRRKNGLSESEWAELLVMLLVAGGAHLADLDWLKMDSGLVKMWPLCDRATPRSALNYLYRFHHRRMESSRQGQARIHRETPALLGLVRVNRQLVHEVQRRSPQGLATIDVDASIHPSTKRSALKTYEGPRGYQPALAFWAEQDLIVGDQFRDGNVPAGMGNQEFLKTVLDELPDSVEKIRVRGDSALYEQRLLRWLDRQSIEFAISADMGQDLRGCVTSLPDEQWKPYPRIGPSGDLVQTDRQCAEVAFVPGDRVARKGEGPFRYIAIRIPREQGDLFEGHHNHFAVVTNRWDDPAVQVLNWQRQRCGSVERVHDLLKNDMGARGFPSDRFGANAAWYRLNVIALNLTRAVLRLGFPAEWHDVRPSTFRFRIIRIAGRIVSHSRQLTEVLSRRAAELRELIAASRARLGARP